MGRLQPSVVRLDAPLLPFSIGREWLASLVVVVRGALWRMMAAERAWVPELTAIGRG